MRILLLILLMALVLMAVAQFDATDPPTGQTLPNSPAKAVAATDVAMAAIQAPVPTQVAPELTREAAQAERSSADLADVDWKKQALDYVARTDPGNDVGHRTVLQLLKQFVDNECRMTGAAVASAPTPEDVENNSAINPTGCKLTADEKVQLAAMLADFAERKRVARADLYIATQIETSRAIIAGDYETHPQPKAGESNADVLLKARAAAAKYFDNPRDENLNGIPGVDFSTYRIIVLKPGSAPGYMSVRRRLRLIDAEEGIALRSVFFPGGPTRR